MHKVNELLITLSFIPLLVFGSLAGQKKIPGAWPAVGVGLLCLSIFIYKHGTEPVVWLPLVAFVLLLFSELLETRKISPLEALSFLFTGQALISNSLAYIAICLIISDAFLNLKLFMAPQVSEKDRAIHRIFRSLFSFLPVLLAIILDFSGPALTGAVVLTMGLRLFSWPVNHWVSDSDDGRFLNLIVSGGSTFALWHALDFSGQPQWAIVWLALAAVLSLGAAYYEVVIAMILGAFCVSPTFGIIGFGVLPLLLHRGRESFALIIFVAASGAVICDYSTKVLLENAVYFVGALTALMIARSLVAVKVNKRSLYYEGVDFLIVAAFVATAIYFLPLPKFEVAPVQTVFVGVFLVGLLAGKLLCNKRPSIFVLVKGRERPIWPDREESLSALRQREGQPFHYTPGRFSSATFNLIESESHWAWMLGVLGFIILWGAK
jgi:hypothetical protein